MKIYEFLSLIFLFGQTCATAGAAWFAYRAYRQTQEISAQQQKQTDAIHNEQKELTRIQTFIPLSERLIEIRDINLADPNWEDIIKSANLLEIIAVAYNEKLIKESILLGVYGRLFVRTFKQISSVKDNGVYLGRNILRSQCPSTVEIYYKLLKYYQIENNEVQLDIKG